MTINSFQIVNYRAKEIKEDEALVCYWGYYVDWIVRVWIMMFVNVRFVRKRLKKIDRAKRRKMKE